MKIYHNPYFTLYNEDNKLLIEVHKPGYNLKNFNQIIVDMPVIKVTNFISLKNALANAANMKIHIGYIKPKFEVIISSDELEAKIKLNISEAEYERDKAFITSQIIPELIKNGVKEGFLYETISSNIPVQKEIVVAKGQLPVDGRDAQIRYYNIEEKKPVVRNDGSVNYYELNLIDNVKAGDWLGEKILPTEGIPGRTVTGKIIPPKRGRDMQLKYDKKTIKEVKSDDKITLYALIDGAVKIVNGKITIQNHLIIEGDVGYDTGNINFEGSITINGTVKDGFSVVAKDDISILSPMGIGAVSKIVSKEGSIYIKGGIYGKTIASIEAGKDVFVKYCNECKITAGDTIHIGFYSLDCILNARKIVTDPENGKIIGGTANAKIQIISATIGNKLEKRTNINVEGFNRLEIKKQLDDSLEKLDRLVRSGERIRKHLEIYENSLPGAEYGNIKEYNAFLEKYQSVVDQINEVNQEVKYLQKILQTKGEGEVNILKSAYPRTFIKIKQLEKKIFSLIYGKFYAIGNELLHD